MSQPYMGQHGPYGPQGRGPSGGSSAVKTVLIVLGSIFGVGALCILVCCGGFYFFVNRAVEEERQRRAEVERQHEENRQQFEAEREARRRASSSRSSSSPSRPRIPEPKNAAEALTALRSSDSEKKEGALRWLARTKSNRSASRKPISDALVKLLDDFKWQKAAASALKNWGDQQAVSAILQRAHEGSPMRDEAVETLAVLADPQSSAFFAELLSTTRHHFRAKRVLETIGKQAEKDVTPHVNAKSHLARSAARELLKKYGTANDVLVAQCVKDLRTDDDDTRNAAADYLSTLGPGSAANDPRRDEVAMALEAALKKAKSSPHSALSKAFVKWVSPVNKDGLVKILQNDEGGVWQTALKASSKLKDPALIKPIAEGLTNFFKRGESARALREIGPPAQMAVIEMLTHSDGGVRREAALILQDIGTRACLPALERAGRSDSSGSVKRVAQDAFSAILRSGRVSKPEMRVWTDASGKFKIEAEFLDNSTGKIRLRKKNGKTVSIPLTQLSPADQKYIRDELHLRKLLKNL